jgi:polysaccharide pyruvyl transferase WcaK-like protein
MSFIGHQVHQFRWNLPLIQERTALPRSRPRAAYIGWHGNGNLGDDAMFRAASQLLPGHSLATFQLPQRERYLRNFGLSGGRFFDAVILGGGTLINPLWMDFIREAIDGGAPLYTLGTGVGSCGFEQPDGIEIKGWKEMLSRFKRVGVRGPRSRQSLQEIGVQSEIIGDLALTLTQETVPERSDPPRLALNIALAEGTDYDAPENAFLQEAEAVTRDFISQGWEVVPFAMTPADVAPVTRFLKEIGRPDQTTPVLSSAEQFFALVGPCVFTMAVRLHGAILSTCVGVPPLMLGYRDKCLDFMESIGMPEWHVGLSEAQPGEITDRAQALAQIAPRLRHETLGRAKTLQKRIKAYAVESFAPSS